VLIVQYNRAGLDVDVTWAGEHLITNQNNQFIHSSCKRLDKGMSEINEMSSGLDGRKDS